MTVTWEPPPDIPDGVDVTYDIAWIASDRADEPGAHWQLVPGVGGGSIRHRLLGPSGIANGVSYDVKMRAVTDHDGQWSETATTTPFERASRLLPKKQPAVPFGVPIGGFLGDWEKGLSPDWFKFELTTRTGVLVTTGGSIRNTECQVFRSSDTPVPASHNHSVGGVLNVNELCMVYVILDPGTYYLMMRGDDGSFWARLDAVPPTGRSLETALPVALDAWRYGHFGLDSSESEFWRLDVAEREFVDLRLLDLYSGVSVSLHDSTGKEREALVTSWKTFCSSGSCRHYGKRVRAELAAGTYYLKVGPESRWGASYLLVRGIDHGLQGLISLCGTLERGEGVDDAYAGCQWHLDNRGQRAASPGEDANVIAAHRAGYLGEGVGVAVVDSGIHLGHEDLSANTDASRSRAYCGSDTAPFSLVSDHGTAVAGVIAARDNAIGMRGVAPRATLHNRRLIDLGCSTSDANLADAMTRAMSGICVSNNSWGYQDGHAATAAPLLYDLAVDQGLKSGCGGKGISYVWSAGNGAEDGDDANLDELHNRYGAMAVCAVNASGVKSAYSETGANLWVCGPSNDRSWTGEPGIATLTRSSRYRLDFGGTSAAAPVVAGVAALVRAANPELTWRDVKLILAETARRNDPGDGSWREGAAKYGEPGERYWHSRRYGFGVVDAHAAAQLAETWANLPPMITATRTYDGESLEIPDAPGAATASVTFDDAIEFVEFVQIDTSFAAPNLRELRIELVSPSGTEVLVLPELSGPLARYDAPLSEPFRFGVAGLLGEPAQGTWTLRVSDENPDWDYDSSLDGWGITLYGHGSGAAGPRFAAETANLEVAENTAAGAAIGDPVTAAAAGAGATLTYTLGGADAASFAIDSATGQISTSAALDFEAPADSDGDNTYELSVSVSDGLDEDGEPDLSSDDSVAVRVEVLDVNEPPIFRGASRRLENALPGFLVSLPLRQSDFSDPDGDPLAFTITASRDDVFARLPHEGLPDGFLHNERLGRVFFVAKTTCALAHVAPPAGDAYETVITMTATDPDGESATATATFRTDPTVFACPSLTGATADGTTLTLTFDANLAPSYAEPIAAEFAVEADGVTIAVTDAIPAPPDIWSDTSNTIILTLVTPVWGGQNVTVSYRPDATPVAAAFADQPATNNSPAPPEPEEAETPEEPDETETPEEPDETDETETPDESDESDESETPEETDETETPEEPEVPETPDETDEPEVPACAPDPEGPMVPVCAAVSGDQLTLTFNRDLAAVSGASAHALRWAFLIEGAYDRNGTPTTQSPNQVTVHANTLTLTLGTPVRAGDDVTVTYWGGLHNTDNTPIAEFTTTLTTTQRE